MQRRVTGRKGAGATRGQVVPVVAVALTLAGLVLWVLAHLGTVLVSAAQARTAADAAALAGAARGREAAQALAAQNGGALVRFVVDGTDTEVTVRVGSVHATARATRQAIPGG